MTRLQSIRPAGSMPVGRVVVRALQRARRTCRSCTVAAAQNGTYQNAASRPPTTATVTGVLRALAVGPQQEQHDGADDDEEDRRSRGTAPARANSTAASGAVLARAHARRRRRRSTAWPATGRWRRRTRPPSSRRCCRRRSVNVSSNRKNDRGDGEQLRDREPQAGELAEGPAADRQGQDAEHAHHLQRHAVGQHDVEQPPPSAPAAPCRTVHREAGVPIGGPAGEPPVREDVVTQVGRAPHVGAHVAAGRAWCP